MFMYRQKQHIKEDVSVNSTKCRKSETQLHSTCFFLNEDICWAELILILESLGSSYSHMHATHISTDSAQRVKENEETQAVGLHKIVSLAHKHIPGTAAVTADLILQSQIQSNSAMCKHFLQITVALSLWNNIWSY